MKVFNWEITKRNAPSQLKLGGGGGIVGSYNRMGLGFTIEEFNVFSQIKDYRTDMLNGTNWRAKDQLIAGNFQYMQFIKLLQGYSTAIFNDYISVGYVVFAKIDGQVYYISQKNYTKTSDKTTVHGYPKAEVFEFYDQNVFCGELSISKKCEPYQRLYNIALSCQKNGMYKSGFVNVVTPRESKVVSNSTFTDQEIAEMEKAISESHGVATDEQSNFLLLRNPADIKTIYFDFSKLGILETKKLCEEYICSKLGVPYVLLPSTGQTFANYEEANKILYENHSKYCEYFSMFAKNQLGFDIDYKTIAESGKGIV